MLVDRASLSIKHTRMHIDIGHLRARILSMARYIEGSHMNKIDRPLERFSTMREATCTYDDFSP